MLRKSDQAGIVFPEWLAMLFTRRKRALIMIAIGASAATALSPASVTAADFDERLEAAIHQEMVLGDLKAAMKQYQAIAAQSTGNATAARALYRYARCLEKLDRRTEAYDVYTRLAKDSSDQAEASLARSRLVNWEYSVSGPANLNFEQGATGKLPDAWFVPALPKDADHWAQLRRSDCMHDSCAVVLVPENAPVRVGNLMQSFSAAAYRGKTVRLTAWLRLDALAPDDRAQMWLSVDRADDQKGFYDDMSDRPMRSSQWTFSEIRGRIDPDATFIKFGVMSIGRGRVWVDHVSFEVVPDATASRP
jgi:tetratricopeptide (TPR) repeat protein